MSEVVGKIPEFTSDDSAVEEGQEGVIKDTDLGSVQETETPAEHPAESEAQAEEQKPASTGEDTEQVEIPQEALNKALANATQGLRNEVVELRRQLAEARGNDRKLIQDRIDVTQQKVDDLEGVNPDDAALIEKVLRAKGYVTKQEAEKLTFETVQKQTLNEFLDKYPEYKPENDPNDVNWSALNRELSLYRMPQDPAKIREILERAHKVVHPQVVGDPQLQVKKRAIQVASVGAGGAQRSSSSGKLSPEQRRIYEEGGWSEDEITQIEKTLD